MIFRITFSAFLLFASTAFAQTEAPALQYNQSPAMQPREVAKLQVLDKISARVTELTVKVGGQAAFGRLVITPRVCQVNPPSEAPEAAVFLEISEININSLARSTGSAMKLEPPKLIFTGWMFASSPALSTLEHPVYDVVLLGCENPGEKQEEAAPAPAPAPAAPEAAPLD